MTMNSGRISTAGAAPYSVAKYGVEAWNDAIRSHSNLIS